MNALLFQWCSLLQGIIIFHNSSSEWLLCNTFPWLNPDSPLLVEEVAKSTSSLVAFSGGGVLQMDLPDVVSGSAPSSDHTCQFQGTICAYRSGCLRSETVQDGPSSSDARLLFSLWPVATAAIIQHLQKAKRASWQRVTASCHQRYYGH